MPPGVGVSGLESDGGAQFFFGGGSSGKVKTVRRSGQAPPSRARRVRSRRCPLGALNGSLFDDARHSRCGHRDGAAGDLVRAKGLVEVRARLRSERGRRPREVCCRRGQIALVARPGLAC